MNTLDAHSWLADHGDDLFRVARRPLHSDELAEAAVQEALLAALSAQVRYSGDASPRSWLTGILKHKIVDLIRQDGHWAEPLRPWGNPQAETELGQLRQLRPL